MQSIVDWTEERVIAEAAHGTGELSRAGFVRLYRHTDGDAPAVDDHVATVQRSRITDLHDFGTGGQSQSAGEYGRNLSSPGRRSGPGRHHERRPDIARPRKRQHGVGRKA